MEKVRQKLSVVLTKGSARESAKDTLVKKVSLNTNLFSDSFHMDAEKRCTVVQNGPKFHFNRDFVCTSPLSHE